LRIDARLKEKGFYYFLPDYLKVQVDSTVADHQVDLIVKVKRNSAISANPVPHQRHYRISNYSINAIALLPQQIQL
jgi:hypothetical protein